MMWLWWWHGLARKNARCRAEEKAADQLAAVERVEPEARALGRSLRNEARRNNFARLVEEAIRAVKEDGNNDPTDR